MPLNSNQISLAVAMLQVSKDQLSPELIAERNRVLLEVLQGDNGLVKVGVKVGPSEVILP